MNVTREGQEPMDTGRNPAMRDMQTRTEAPTREHAAAIGSVRA